MRTPEHLYVHVPFCRSKCAYCAFHSTVETPPDGYADRIATEARLRAPGGLAAQTVYVGGGTPTALGPDGLALLCAAIRGSLRADAPPPREWTVEANPGTLCRETAIRLRAAGVTRLSLGAQAFDAATLARLGRRHDADAIRGAVAIARSAGFAEVGLDLIAGVPGTGPTAWTRTLEAALALEPDHLSVYALTVEPGTALADAVAEGTLRMPDDDAQLDALALAGERLAAAGFHRYEISNYARPGHECRHNLAVWRGEDYLGLGPSAASRWGLCRWTNHPDNAAWSAALAAGILPPRDEEVLPPGEDATERFVTGLRLTEGVAPDRSSERGRAWEGSLRRLASLGLVEAVGTRWRLTGRGREVADAVAAELLPAPEA